MIASTKPTHWLNRPALQELRSMLLSVYRGEAQADCAAACLQELVQRRGVPREYPEALLDGMGMDAAGTQYRSLDELLLYCHRVAGVVGLMMCHVLGVSDSRRSATRRTWASPCS